MKLNRKSILIIMILIIPMLLQAGASRENRNLVNDVEKEYNSSLNEEQLQLLEIMTPVYLNNWQKESLEDLTDEEYRELVINLTKKMDNKILMGAVKTGRFGEKLVKALTVDAKIVWNKMVDHVEEKSKEYDSSQ